MREHHFFKELDRLHSNTLRSKFTFVDEHQQQFEFVPAENLARIAATSRILSSHVPSGASVGLLFKSEPTLLLVWFASLMSGLRPLILQYPTRKQSRVYWSESVNHTISNVGLEAIIADAHCAALLDSSCGVPLISGSVLDEQAPAVTIQGFVLPDRFDIIQLSSGTTGFRKAVEFSSEQLFRHALDYNDGLKLTENDCIISWLPLYHDMGYIACFVMPLLLGIDVVMMDPITWVQTPDLLFDVIERHGGTVCYMPNFGFEVMSRVKGRRLPTMRRWISCSEPVSEGN